MAASYSECQCTFPPTAHRVDLNLLNFYFLKELKSTRSKYGCAHFLCRCTVGTRDRRALKSFRTQTSGLSEGSAVWPWHDLLCSSRSFPLTVLTSLPTAWLLINTDQRIKVRIKVSEEGRPFRRRRMDKNLSANTGGTCSVPSLGGSHLLQGN